MRLLIGLLIAVFAASQSSAPGEAEDVLAQLSKIRLDKKEMYNIRDITIRRDAISISFNRGTIAFLEPVRGKVTGAVFIGSGEAVAIPSDSIEKQQLFKFTGSPLLNEPFRAAFFRFTDNTYEEIIKAYNDHAHEDVTDFESAQFLPWDNTLSDRSGLLNYRILTEFLGRSDRPLFFGELNGERSGWFDVVYDPRLIEEVAVVRTVQGSNLLDMWVSSNRREKARNRQAAANESKAVFDVLAYEVDATISATTQLDAKASVRLKGLIDGERVLNLDLSRFLRVSSVTMESGQAIPFYQHVNMSEQEIRQYGVNAFVIVLPQPLKTGQEITLKFTYSGDVIEKRGNGIFYVGDRGLWYPNLGHQDRAAFNLTFHFPAAYTLVATGTLAREWEEGGLRHSAWRSDGEFPVAGFNLGDFSILADESAPVPIYVCVNNDVETIYKEVAARRALQRETSLRAAASVLGRRGTPPPAAGVISPDYSAFSTKGLAENVLKEVRATLTYYSNVFGPYPYRRLTVSQFPVNFSQGWPSLLYVSTLSFFDTQQREKLGLDSESDFIQTELVRAHEIAHQWFGNQVGWRSYRDQWLSEGFSNYAGAMYIEHKYPDTTRFKEILDDARTKLLDRAPDGNTNESGGPLWLGHRLSNSLNPNGYLHTVYNKGTWVVHMLRMLMRGNGANPDEAFHKMTREIVNTHKNSLMTTFDFKRIAEKHMTKAMDLRGDGKLDWFFDQWVFGTGVPKYTMEHSVEPSKDGFVVSGTLKQSEVPEDFIMPVPLYADDVFLGKVTVSGGEGSFRFVVKSRPARISLDPHATVLSQPNGG